MKRNMLKTIVCIIATISILGCNDIISTSNVSNIWSKLGGNGRLFYSNTSISDQISVCWDIKLGNTMTWSNIVCDSKFLYAVIDGIRGHEIVKIRKKTGTVLADTVFRDLPKSLKYQLELVEGKLVVLCDSEMIVLETDKMHALWTEKTRISNIQSMTVSKNNILAASTDGYAYSLLLSTGMPYWEIKLEDGFDFEFITVKDDLAIFSGFGLGEGNSLTVCLDSETGEQRWSYVSDGVASKPPQIADQNVFITETGKFSCLDLEDNGRFVWSNNLKDDETDQPVTTDAPITVSDTEVVYIVGEKLKFVNLRHGHTEKILKLKKNLIPKFVVQSKNHLFLLADGTPFLYQYDKATYDLISVVNGIPREVTSVAISDVLIVQTRESIICLK